jgi:hypothetical protein
MADKCSFKNKTSYYLKLPKLSSGSTQSKSVGLQEISPSQEGVGGAPDPPVPRAPVTFNIYARPLPPPGSIYVVEGGGGKHLVVPGAAGLGPDHQHPHHWLGGCQEPRNYGLPTTSSTTSSTNSTKGGTGGGAEKPK